MTDLSTHGFGVVLRQFRLRAGLSQEELGARARLSAETIGALERGTRRAPYRTTVDLLAQGLALTPSELVDETDPHERDVGLERAPRRVTASPDQGPTSPASRVLARVATAHITAHVTTRIAFV